MEAFPMKRWLLLAVLVVAITTTATLAVQYFPTDSWLSVDGKYPAPATSSGPQPLAVVEGDLTYHFGMAAQQATIEKDWVIRNEGEADLILTKGPPACSCTIADFENGKDTITLKPGQKTTHHLAFHTNENNGTYRKSATIATNDPLHPTLEFFGEGTVRPSVMLYPPESTINYLEISNDVSDHKAGVALYSPDRPDLKITQLISSKPGKMLVSQEPMTPEDCKALGIEKGYRITINVTSAMPLGSFREEAIIKIDHPKQPEVKLMVAGKMVGPISATPDRIRLVGVDNHIGAKGELRLTVRGLRATTFEVRSKPDKFDVEIVPTDPSSQGGQYRLIVTIPPGLPPKTILDDIVLKTDHPQAEELRIPIDVLIRQ